MRSRIAVALGAFFVGGTPAACSSFSETSEAPPVLDGGTEAAATPVEAAADGGVDAFAAADATDALPAGTLLSEGFENATGTACAAWAPVSGATAIVSTKQAHSGTASCYMCFPLNAYVDRVVDVTQGGTYTALLSVRPDTAMDMQLGLYFVDATTAEVPGSKVNTAPLNPGQWTTGQTTAKPVMAPAQVYIRVSAPSVAGSCFYVDDVRLERAP